MKALAALLLVALVGCTAPSDDDGELGAIEPAPVANADATPVVVDTDLGGDDLAAIAFLLRHPSVEVVGFTIPTTGLVGCERGADLLAGLLRALEEPELPVACGASERGPSGLAFPEEWVAGASRGFGVSPGEATLSSSTAEEFLADLARDQDLVVVALGPLTTLAGLAPDDYAAIDRVVAMGGSVDGPLLDGVAEWNAAADPEAFASVLAGPVPLTIVPEDAIPDGTPEVLDGPVLGRIADAANLPRWWDLATAAVVVDPEAGEVSEGSWALDPQELGRLRRVGDGGTRVYRELSPQALEVVYAEALE